jgi:hypothetical protein
MLGLGTLLFALPSVQAKSQVQKEIRSVEEELRVVEHKSKALPSIPNYSQSYTRTRSRSPQQSKIGLNVTLHYNTVAHIKTTNNSIEDELHNNQSYLVPTARTTGEYQTKGAMGIGVEYSKIRLISTGPLGFGFDLGALYEFPREIDRSLIETRSGGSNYTYYSEENPKLSLFLPYANANISYKRSYFFGGVNYSIPQTANADDEIYASGLGYHVGFGSAVSKWLSMEVAYRIVNLKVSPRNTYEYNYRGNLSDPDNPRDGLGVLADEDLSMQGITLTMKVRF